MKELTKFIISFTGSAQQVELCILYFVSKVLEVTDKVNGI